MDDWSKWQSTDIKLMEIGPSKMSNKKVSGYENN